MNCEAPSLMLSLYNVLSLTSIMFSGTQPFRRSPDSNVSISWLFDQVRNWTHKSAECHGWHFWLCCFWLLLWLCLPIGYWVIWRNDRFPFSSHVKRLCTAYESRIMYTLPNTVNSIRVVICIVMFWMNAKVMWSFLQCLESCVPKT